MSGRSRSMRARAWLRFSSISESMTPKMTVRFGGRRSGSAGVATEHAGRYLGLRCPRRKNPMVCPHLVRKGFGGAKGKREAKEPRGIVVPQKEGEGGAKTIYMSRVFWFAKK